jgi:hypothetical protein
MRSATESSSAPQFDVRFWKIATLPSIPSKNKEITMSAIAHNDCDVSATPTALIKPKAVKTLGVIRNKVQSNPNL